MKHRTPRIVALLAAVGAAFIMTACGGGGDEETPDPVVLLSETESFVRLTKIVERSDAFNIPALHFDFDYTLAIDNSNPQEESGPNDVTCMGNNCDVTAVRGGMQSAAVQDLIDLTGSIDQVQVSLGSRDGFDTIAVDSELDVSNIVLDEGFTATPPTATAFGAWGEQGFAGVIVGTGELNGEALPTVNGAQTRVDFTGELSYALAFAMGDTSGTNPMGTGVATWEGVVEAVSLITYEHRLGTATLVIADLVNPRVSVDIDVDGSSVNPPEWANLPLTNGGFTFGTVTDGNYVAGNFHGPEHEEAYGVFDTEAYTGAFGAKREN